MLTTLLPHDQECTERQIDALLDESLPTLGPHLRKCVKDAFAIAAYRTQTAYPVVDLFLCDDAPQFNWLTAELALCWIHEFRHDKKLTPHIPSHRQMLDPFSESFWKLYRDLLASRDLPSRAEADALRAEFERLFKQTSGSQQLDERKARTLAKKEHLLMVLIHPEMLLHNNPAELGVRQRVRKRDVSEASHATCEGIGAWDTFETQLCTAKKLGVNLFRYVHDRIAQTNKLPSLATLIAERAQDLPLAASWGRGP